MRAPGHWSHKSFSCLLFMLAMALPGVAALPASQNLDSGWEFRVVGASGRTELTQWHPAQVPGVIQTDLLRNSLIPEPFYQDNEARLQWIGRLDWEYRTTFNVEATTLARRHVDLLFDGLDTFAEVYLNDQLILKADNMFRHWRVPAKALLKPGANNLRIVFRSAVESMLPYVESLPYILPAISTVNGGNENNIPTAPYTRKAPYQYGWDWGPRFVTEGIWQPVRLESWDALRIESFHIHQNKITLETASLNAELEIESVEPASVSITYSHDDLNSAPIKDGSQTVQLDAGMNQISFPIHIASPKLWYPLGYGSQGRYHFAVSIKDRKETEAQADLKTGLRSVELRRVPDDWGKSFAFVINGIQVFAKGADVIPFDSFPPRVTPARHREILEAARDAHMNMVREWGGGYYESDDFYDICDELGILVWQEFAFGGDMVPPDLPFQQTVREEAVEQIKRLRDHPSIVIWCGNNEVETGWFHWGERQTFKESISPAVRERLWQGYVILFADVLKSAVRQYADPVPYWPSSPGADFEEPPDSFRNGDMHYWGVWHAQAPKEDYLQQFPRFMSEFGFQSFPEMRTIQSFAKPEDLDIRSVVMQSHQRNKGGNERILTYMLREYSEPKDFASFVYLSQVQQAEIIKIGAEHLRRQRPRTMGSLYWQLNDCWPVASWSSIDYYGRWKALQYYARRFYDDLLISPYVHDNKVDVFVVSDKLQPISGVIHYRMLDFTGHTLLDQTLQVQLPPQSSASYLLLDQSDLAQKGDPRQTFLVFDLEVGGQRVSRNLIFQDVTHNLKLPVAPRIETTITGSGPTYQVTLRSSELARNVYLSLGDLDARLSDNYFDLLPGEPQTITIKSASTQDQLKRAMKITSLMEAFARPATTP
ncbi:MAG TPA: glycoside hydrolase family 2 protein [Candidatus Angelobacter sp.]|nr:glycoside hydrolase family 2 protein [Candidatus Angelobacter sp.]